MLIRVILLVLGLLHVRSVQYQYELWKHYAGDLSDKQQMKLGEVQISILPEYNEITGTISSNFPTLITREDLKNGVAILSFKNKKTNQSVFSTSISESIQTTYCEKIIVIVDAQLNIKAFNYLQEKFCLKDEVQVEVSRMETAKQQKLQFIKLQFSKNAAPQEESFWAKYKWPIIIVGVILYLSSTSNTKQAPAQQ